MSLKEIKKVNVSDEVYRQILNEIVKKNLQSGDKLPSESELVQTFGVSRVSVRAALQKLAGAGIIESVNGGGSYVKHIQERAVLGDIMPLAAFADYNSSQLVDFRRGIEVLSAELAARFGEEQEIAELQAIYDNMQECSKQGDAEKYSEYDIEFHMQIARMSKNPFVLYVMEQMREILYIHIRDLNEKKGPDKGINYHSQILQMIKSHDLNGARECMNRNLQHTLQQVMEDEK